MLWHNFFPELREKFDFGNDFFYAWFSPYQPVPSMACLAAFCSDPQNIEASFLLLTSQKIRNVCVILRMREKNTSIFTSSVVRHVNVLYFPKKCQCSIFGWVNIDNPFVTFPFHHGDMVILHFFKAHLVSLEWKNWRFLRKAFDSDVSTTTLNRYVETYFRFSCSLVKIAHHFLWSASCSSGINLFKKFGNLLVIGWRTISFGSEFSSTLYLRRKYCWHHHCKSSFYFDFFKKKKILLFRTNLPSLTHLCPSLQGFSSTCSILWAWLKLELA